MYESVRELELKPTAGNKPKPKTEEEWSGKTKRRRAAGKEETTPESSRLGSGTSTKSCCSHSDEQTNVLGPAQQKGLEN